MIYTVTFNPAIDYVVRLDRPLEVGEVNRAAGEDCVLGGKGINVSGVLAQLGCESVAHLQLTVQPHNVVNGRVECHCVDHCSVSFTSVSCLYFGSGQRFVRIAPL